MHPVIALVPARGGSRRLPGKNLARVGGATLVERAVRVAAELEPIDEVVVSSDAVELLDEARRVGATALERPAAIAVDATPTVEVVRHLLDHYPATATVVVLQPTSPLREGRDILRCLESMTGDVSSVATVARNDHPLEWGMRLCEDGTLDPVFGWDALRRGGHEHEATYRLNGAVYVVRSERMRGGGDLVGPDTRAVIMPAYRSIDIDDESDLWMASLIHQAVEREGPPTQDGRL